MAIIAIPKVCNGDQTYPFLISEKAFSKDRAVSQPTRAAHAGVLRDRSQVRQRLRRVRHAGNADGSPRPRPSGSAAHSTTLPPGGPWLEGCATMPPRFHDPQRGFAYYYRAFVAAPRPTASRAIRAHRNGSSATDPGAKSTSPSSFLLVGMAGSPSPSSHGRSYPFGFVGRPLPSLRLAELRDEAAMRGRLSAPSPGWNLKAGTKPQAAATTRWWARKPETIERAADQIPPLVE